MFSYFYGCGSVAITSGADSIICSTSPAVASGKGWDSIIAPSGSLAITGSLSVTKTGTSSVSGSGVGGGVTDSTIVSTTSNIFVTASGTTAGGTSSIISLMVSSVFTSGFIFPAVVISTTVSSSRR